MNWPTPEELDAAIQQWQVTLQDSILRQSQLEYDPITLLPRHVEERGQNIRVYIIGDWIIRCFCATPEGQPSTSTLQRYAAIAHFTEAHATQVPALVHVEYQEHGITLPQGPQPLVKMDYIAKTLTIGSFIADNYEDETTMRTLSNLWMTMISGMEHIPMAHGDLDLTNVLVQTTPDLRLRLIDYDSMWIPELKDMPQSEQGHLHFQHPAFIGDKAKRPYDATMDRFSALSIYISLVGISLDPSLYDRYQADESSRLLLSMDDYATYNWPDRRLHELKSYPELEVYVDALIHALDTRQMPPRLDTIAKLTASEQIGEAEPQVHLFEAPPPPIFTISSKPPSTPYSYPPVVPPPPPKSLPYNPPAIQPVTSPAEPTKKSFGGQNLIFLTIGFIILSLLLCLATGVIH